MATYTNFITKIKGTNNTEYYLRDLELQSAVLPQFSTSSVTYAVGDIIEYDGVAYTCKSGYTTSSSSGVPSADTSHWDNSESLAEIVKNIETSASTTDEKLKVTALTSGTAYYPILATGTGTATRQIDSTYNSFKITITGGSTSTTGTAILQLGNDITGTAANNVDGQIRIYSSLYAALIRYEAAYDGNTIYLPMPSAANQSNYIVAKATNTAVGSNTQPVYVDAFGHVQTAKSYATATGSKTTGITISDHDTTQIKQFAAGGSGSFSATVTNNVMSFSHTHTAATSSNITVVTGTSHTVTDPGHTHSISYS